MSAENNTIDESTEIDRDDIEHAIASSTQIEDYLAFKATSIESS